MSLTKLQVKKEIATDKKKYFENCRLNYSEYTSIAIELFSGIYTKMEEMDKTGDPWTKYNSKASKIKNDEDAEIEILEKAVANKVYTPGTYNRLAVLYGKKKDYKSAYLVCDKWFKLDFWKLPNTARGSLNLLERMEKLEKKINKNVG